MKAMTKKISPSKNKKTPSLQNGLRYVHPEKLTITRVKVGKNFTYYETDGNQITDADVLKRIEDLHIPPAYHEVRICPFSNGHLQATGKDERQRTQYLYHPEWRTLRDTNKFHRLLKFGQVLPSVRRTVREQLKLRGSPRKKILATVVSILDKTYIRIGNEAYAKANKSYGLTTLHNHHARVTGDDIEFSFRGKRGIAHTIKLHDHRLAKIIHNCQELPGYELFEYKDSRHNIHSIESTDVNDYLKSICRDDFTAKDFRTWHATVLALKYLLDLSPGQTTTEIKKNIIETIKQVAAQLGNTPTICKKSYIHPGVLTSYSNNRLAALSKAINHSKFARLSLTAEEKMTLIFLEQHDKNI